jgi:sulfopyruvate decarboxylase subunit alpha
MSVSKEIISLLKEEGIDFVVSLPCKLLDELIRILYDDESFIHIPATREEEGVGICVGAHLAGKIPVLLIQNSGLGNSVNALASLVMYYEIPLIIIASHRGTEGERIKAQVPMGEATPKILEAIGMAHRILERSSDLEKIRESIIKANTSGKPVAILLPFSFWRDDN